MGKFDFERQTEGLTYKIVFTRLCTRSREPLTHCCSLVICFILFVMLDVSKVIIDWLTGWLIDWLIDWLTDCNHFYSLLFLLRLCSVLRDLVSVSASVELFRGPLTHTKTYTKSLNTLIHVVGWWYKFMTHSTAAFNSSRGVCLWRGCVRRSPHVLLHNPARLQPWFKGRNSYLAYYHACASRGIPSFKFSTGV